MTHRTSAPTEPRQRAADLLWRAWQAGRTIDAIPPACRPATRADGYAVQALLAAHSPQAIVGWKIAATSGAGQKHINVGGPLAGRLLAERLHPDGATLSLTGNAMRVAECEFVFRMGRDLPPRAAPYGTDEVLAAVDGLCLGIEVPDSRFAVFTQAGEAQLIADNACAHQMVLGPRVDDTRWRAVDLSAHRVHASVTGIARRYERDGIGANVLGDPRIALAWLVNELGALGVTLAQGAIVTTGTCVAPLELAPGDVVEANFGAFGAMSVRFEA